MAESLYVVTYDLPSNRRRLRLARMLEGYGERVRYSVFEMWLSEAQLEKMLRRIGREIVAEEDSVRIYALCAACRERRRLLGQGKPVEPHLGCWCCERRAAGGSSVGQVCKRTTRLGGPILRHVIRVVRGFLSSGRNNACGGLDQAIPWEA